jgi:hypothetical protein
LVSRRWDILPFVSVDLTTLVPLDGGHLDALEGFVSGCLVDGDVWGAPRESDGIRDNRVLERSPDRLRVCGRIYTIDQALHIYWLEVTRDAPSSGATWVLCFDAKVRSEREARNTWISAARAEDLEWRVVLAGEASIHGSTLAPIAGSTRVLMRDTSEEDALDEVGSESKV